MNQKRLARLLHKATDGLHTVLSPFVSEKKLAEWKPIHLCWWYDELGEPTPDYFISTHINTPTVSTDATPSSITSSAATFDTNNISDTGGENCTERGIVYVSGSGGTPTTADSVVSETGSFGTGNFSATMTGLSPGTTYSVRAYAINSAGTGYGSTVEVTTVANTAPSVSLNSPTDASSDSDTTPTLSFTGTDSESDDIRYNIQIDDTSSGFGSLVVNAVSGTDAGFSGSPDNTDPFTSGQQVDYTVQSALSGGTYYWRVRGIDPSGSNTYGNWSSTRSFGVAILTVQDASFSFTADNTTVDPYENQNYTYNDEATLPTNNTDLANTMTAPEKDDVASDDNTYFDYEGSDFLVKQFEYTHDNSTDEITVTWKGKTTLAPTSSTVYLQIYNYNTTSWETLDSDNTTAADTEFALTGSQTTNLSNYYNSDVVTARVYQDASP